MNRIEKLREYIDNTLLNMADTEERRCAYIHLYSVSITAAMIALKRGENAELATIAGMLHDFYSYATMDKKDHAHKGALFAKSILNDLNITNADETEKICAAIYTHSDKDKIDVPFCEVLKDADVLQHCLYNITMPNMPHEIARYEKLKKEFQL